MVRRFNPPTVLAPRAAYSHGCEIQPGARYIFTAGQVGVDEDGTPLDGIEAQAERVYRNILAILADAGMGADNIVKLTTYMIDPELGPAHQAVKKEILGDIRAPNTMLYIKRLAHPDFQLEVECVAAAD